MRLRALAHSRTGDKGDSVNISVIAYDPADYPLLCRAVTAERVKAHFGDRVAGAVERYELPRLAALNFVLRGALRGGVTRSLALDAHGKCLGSALLELEIEEGRYQRVDEGSQIGTAPSPQPLSHEGRGAFEHGRPLLRPLSPRGRGTG